MKSLNGAFVLTLDFELMWGAINSECDVERGFAQRTQKMDEILPKLLDLFQEYGIHVTWATVGAIACRNIEKALEMMDYELIYPENGFNVKEYIRNIENEKIHFLPGFFEKIAKVDGQYIGSHTFSHFYVAEYPNCESVLKEEIDTSVKLLNRYNDIQSIVFPKNQVDDALLKVVDKCGLTCYRGKQVGSRFNKENKISKIARFIDAYFPLCGRNDYGYGQIKTGNLYNIQASRFFRTYFKPLGVLEWLKILRIKREMLRAARDGCVYHLWFHPHNLATDVEFNLNQLKKIFKIYLRLNEKYGFESLAMEEVASKV